MKSTGTHRQSMFLIVCLLLMMPLSEACMQRDRDKNPPGYDLSTAQRFAMPETLLEISGITFNKGNSDTVYAIQDEEGKLFRLAWNVKKQYHAKFARSGDYEDVTIVRDRVFILKSDGLIYSFPMGDAFYAEVDSVLESRDVLPKGEYESLYGDETTGQIFTICKNCKTDDNKDKITGYVLKFDGQLSQTGTFEVDVKSISSYTGKVKRGFRPSALAKNPITGEWFIISAVNKLLVVADKDWKIKGAYALDGNRFNQPEGIAFDKAGNLYISNEGDDLSDGNILKISRK